jgi:putative membrane protein
MLAMHWNRLGVVAAAGLIAAMACSTGDDADDTAGSDTDAVASTSGGDVVSSPSPAIVMGFLVTVNKGEIEAGELAEEKATDPRIRDYAKMMVVDHGRALKEGTAVGDSALLKSPVGQPAVDAQAMHEQSMNTLRITTKGTTFDSTYIAMMVTGHADVLARLEGMKGTGNNSSIDPVHTHLQNSIDMVRTHLQRAQEVQQALQGGR